jgi:type I restriction enzyme, S subunit
MIELHELRTVCNLKNGFAFKSQDYVEFSKTVSLRMSNIRPGGKFDSEYNQRFLPDNFKEIYSNYLLEDGDLVIAMTDLANDPKILGVPTIVETNGKNWLLNQRVGKLEVKNNQKADKTYLKYILNHPIHRNYYKMFAGGGLQINVGKEEILSIKIPLPNLETQKRIAQILDDAISLRDNTEKLLKEYDALAQSIFFDMFGDPILNPKGFPLSPLKKIATKIGSGATPKGGKEAYHSQGMTLIRSLNIHDNLFKMKDLAFIDENQAKKLNNVSLEKNDVLLNITGASVARCAIVPENLLPARVNQHVSIIRPKKDILNSTFLLHLLISPNSKSKLLGVSSQGGATRESITKEQLEKFEIILPKLNTQIEFAEKITLIEQQKELAKQELKESQDLFNCLLQKAFKGELV